MTSRLRARRWTLVLVACLWIAPCIAAGPTQLRIAYPIGSPYYPVILHGAQLAPLHGEPVERIHAYALRNGVLAPIPFQIDRRDARGTLLLDPEMRASLARDDRFGAHDECVFMAADLGERAGAAQFARLAGSRVELELADPSGSRTAWVYLLVSPDTTAPAVPRYVRYDPGADALETDIYRIGFSRRLPMIADSVQWFEPETHHYGPNVLDVMKIRHSGRFLHQFAFQRNQDDYRSRLVGVRSGPVRVIRRTANALRVLLGLRTPTIDVDYAGYAHAMIADIRLDLPFRVDWLFSDLVTLTTWDGNDLPDLPPTRVYSAALPQGFLIDGRMSQAKHRFNVSGDTAFAVANRFGTLFVTMDFDARTPIRSQAHVLDDRTRPDPPENVPGQFGNIGFRMTGWESLGRGTYHVAYRALLVRDVPVPQGLRLLEQAPPFY